MCNRKHVAGARLSRSRVVVTGMFYLMLLTAISNVTAAPPSGVPFGSWNSTTGTINAACPTGFSCEVLQQDNGFLQRSLVPLDTTQQSAGTGFIQSIVTNATDSVNPVADPDSPGPPQQGYFVESYIPADISGNNSNQTAQNNSISSLQRIGEVAGTVNFQAASEINKGAFLTPQDEAQVKFKQIIQDTAAVPGEELNNRFQFFSSTNPDGSVQKRAIEVRQNVGLQIGSNNIAGSETFVWRAVEGDYNPAAGGTQLLSGPGAATPNTITWAAGDLISGQLILQNIEPRQITPFFTGSQFATERYSNLSANTTIKYLDSFNAATPNPDPVVLNPFGP